MAPPRRPLKVAQLHGERRPDRLNLDEPQPGPGEPVRPQGLSDAQSREWDTVTGHLRTMELLAAADTEVITAYVVISVKCDQLRIKLTGEPDVIRNPANGLPMANPTFDLYLKAVSKMESLATKLGFHPAARSSIRTRAAKATPVGAERLFS